jgi:hypothetical protein
METVLCISRYGAIGPPFAMWLPGITETCIAIHEISKATSILNFLEAEHYGDIAESTIIIYVSSIQESPPTGQAPHQSALMSLCFRLESNKLSEARAK